MAYVDSDGWQVWYEAIGEGPALVCSGGPIMMHDQFEKVNALLAPHFTVINWNWRGAGRSERTWMHGITLDDWVSDLHSVLGQLGVTKAHFWGASSGAALNLRYAARYPERVDRMVLFPNFKAGRRPPFEPSLELAKRGGIERVIWNAYYVATSQEAFESGAVVRMAMEEMEVARRNTPVDVYERVSEVFSGYDLSADVARLAVPVMLLVGGSGRYGAASPGIGGAIKEFRELCPAAKLTVIPKAGGTLPMLEQPEVTVDALLKFLKP